MKIEPDIFKYIGTYPDIPGEFVMTKANGHEAVWAYIPEWYEAVVYRKEPGSCGTREVGLESPYPNHSTIGIKFVRKANTP